MRVLVWNSWVTPAGGMERVALSIANGLVERCERVVLAGPYQTVPVLREQIHPGIVFVPCQFARQPLALAGNWRLLRGLVRQHEIDVISAHGSLLPLLPIRGVPVVWTEHGPRYGDQPILRGTRRLAWRAVQQRLQAGEWKLVGCSDYVRERVASQLDLDAAATAVILNGVPHAERLRALEPPRFAKPVRLGFLGRLEPEKHPFDVFTLDRMLEARGVECEWHVFGDGSLAGEMRRRAAAAPRVKVHGLAASPADAFRRMDALAFLSHGQMEGLPTVILEARQARRPVIAWRVTANPEAAGPHDELVEPFDLDAFAAAIGRVVNRTEAPPAMGEEFSFERMIARYVEVLSEQAAAARRFAGALGRPAAGGAA